MLKSVPAVVFLLMLLGIFGTGVQFACGDDDGPGKPDTLQPDGPGVQEDGKVDGTTPDQFVDAVSSGDV